LCRIRDDNIAFVTVGFDTAAKPAEADMEDLFEPAVYDALVNESYCKELKGKKLALNAQIPRIVERCEHAFQDLGIEFHKTRPARLLLNKMATDAATIIPAATVKRFERLFTRLSRLHTANVKRNSEPFS